MSYRWKGIECDSLKELEALMRQQSIASVPTSIVDTPASLDTPLHKYRTGQGLFADEWKSVPLNVLDTIDLNTRAMETLIDLTKCLKIELGQIFSAKSLELISPKYGSVALNKMRTAAREALGEIHARKAKLQDPIGYWSRHPDGRSSYTHYASESTRREPSFWIETTADVGYALRELRDKRIEIGFEGLIEHARLKRVDDRPGKGAKYVIECPCPCKLGVK